MVDYEKEVNSGTPKKADKKSLPSSHQAKENQKLRPKHKNLDKSAGRTGIPAGLDIPDILNALPFYVMLVDADHRIVLANRAVLDQLGMEPQEIVGKYCPEAIHGLKEPWYACPLEEAVSKDGVAIEREAFDNTSGRWIRSVVYPIRDTNKSHGKIFFHMVSDVTDRKQTEEQLRNSNEQLHKLSVHLESIREQERTKMARELHDELGQILTTLKIDFSRLTRKIPAKEASISETRASINESIDSAIQVTRRISAESRPGILDDLGLGAALEWQAQEFEKRARMKVKFTSIPEDIVLDRDRSTAIFRIFQEALTNITRHARATKVEVELIKETGRIRLTVRDNGRGIKQKQVNDAESFGLIGMKGRARFLGGNVEITGTPGKGTLVTAIIPLTTGESKDVENTNR